MDSYWMNLALVGLLVLVNAVFSGSEMALLSLRESQLPGSSARVGYGAGASGPVGPGPQPLPGHDPDRDHAGRVPRLGHRGGLALGRTAGGVAGFPRVRPPPVSLDRAGHHGADVPDPGLRRARPKRIATQRTEGWALLAARPLGMPCRFFRPVVWRSAGRHQHGRTPHRCRTPGAGPADRQEPGGAWGSSSA